MTSCSAWHWLCSRTENDVKDLIKTTDINKSSDPDGASPKIVKRKWEVHCVFTDQAAKQCHLNIEIKSFSIVKSE